MCPGVGFAGLACWRSCLSTGPRARVDRRRARIPVGPVTAVRSGVGQGVTRWAAAIFRRSLGAVVLCLVGLPGEGGSQPTPNDLPHSIRRLSGLGRLLVGCGSGRLGYRGTGGGPPFHAGPVRRRLFYLRWKKTEDRIAPRHIPGSRQPWYGSWTERGSSRASRADLVEEARDGVRR